jgi:ParB-like chromosome segregation protein Spo0J
VVETQRSFFDLEPEPSSQKNLPEVISALVALIERLPFADKIAALNQVRTGLHSVSPFRSQPIDCVLWVSSDKVEANDYNPNTVAPPEMALLALSVEEDGYTQPVVTWDKGDGYEVVDGFHRTRVGKECEAIRNRVLGYLPITVTNADRQDRGDRIASTIRHNRARGKHGVSAMSDIVVELKRRNWSDERISKQLGMEPDEVLRLTQVSGLAEMFASSDFSHSWEIGCEPEDVVLTAPEEEQ